MEFLRAVEKESAEEHEGDDDHRRDGQTDIQAGGGAGQEVACTDKYIPNTSSDVQTRGGA